jgi:hypothetical protein
MINQYIEQKLKIKLTPQNIQELAPLDPDIVKVCVDRALMRADVVNKIAFVISKSKEGRKEVTPYGTFVVHGLTRTKVDSGEQQGNIEDTESEQEESSYQLQGRSYSRAIIISSPESSRLTPQERDSKFKQAQERYAQNQEFKRLHKEKVEMKPVTLEPFRLIRNPDYVDRGEPKSSIQRCAERLKND